MTSTFRLTRAEFKKIFKRPSVYIMALILVAVIFLSLYIFKPAEANNYTINYGNNLTATEYYNTFKTQDLSNSEKGINLSFENTDKMYLYYKYSSERDANLTDYHNNVIELVSKIRNTNDEKLKNTFYDSLKTELNNYLKAYKDFSTLSDYDHIKYTQSEDYYMLNCCHHIQEFIDETKISDSKAIILYYDSNNVEDGLIVDLNNAINYISPTLNYISNTIKAEYEKFIDYHAKGGNAAAGNLVNIEKQRKSILQHTKMLKEYFDTLISNKFPLILVDTTKKNEIVEKLEFSIEALSSINVGAANYAQFDKYTDLKTNLDSINFANYFTNTFNNLKPIFNQIKLQNSLLENFNAAKTKVDKNKTDILQKIDTLKADESIKNIQFKITEYYLLSEAYNNYIYDSIINKLSSNYAEHEFAQKYGYDLDSYNNYQYNERIAMNKYYINNNTYSNSYLNNLSFNQNSNTNTTNVYDFMYFTMELCTIVIIVFSMFMIASFVSGETDSGTIKLLIVRPYKRSKIITSKLLATIFFVVTFMIFSGLISYAAGYYYFGDTTLNILAVFNANTVFEIAPLYMTLINIGTLIIDAIFFVLLALMIAVLCKHYAASIYVCIIFIVTLFTLNALFGGAYWFSFLPTMNLHLFKYFGNAFVPLGSSVFQNILITPIQSSMNFAYSILLTMAYSLISIAVSYSVFNKRDF